MNKNYCKTIWNYKKIVLFHHLDISAHIYIYIKGYADI